MEEVKVFINKKEIFRQVHLRNYYMGESAKRQELNADLIQSSTDDEILLESFLERACSLLAGSIALRLTNFKYNSDENYSAFIFETTNDSRNNLISLLNQQITDFLINEVCIHWLLLRMPTLAEGNIAMRTSLYTSVQDTFAKFYNIKKVRRRSTDLAGI